MDIIKARAELMKGKTIYDMELNVADYGRVSTDKDDQLNSLENQVKFFTDMVSGVKSWNHVGSYSDEGISGTQVYKREQFLKMIEDARLGKIDLILTKEVSRFARNTVDSITYTQELLKYGVIVFFISDNINTIYPDSEFRLTLMASMAQDEVRKLSERVKFGIKRSIKDRKLGGGGLYGYHKEKGKLTIIPEEAEVVRLVYSMYCSDDCGFGKIGLKLAELGHYTRNGNIFSDTTLKKMVTNPRYKGYYTANLSEVEDYKTHRKVAKPREEWIVEKDESGNIPAIVDESLWNKANQIHDKRKKRWNKNVLNKEFYLEERNYTSKIFCSEHNTTFIRSASCKRKNNPTWQCNEYLRHGIKGCMSPILYEEHLNSIFTDILESFIKDKDKLLNTIINDYADLIKSSNAEKNTEKLKDKIKEQELFKDRLFDMVLKNMITENEFKNRNDKITDEINRLKQEIAKLESNKESPGYYKNITDKIAELIKPNLDIKNNIGKYFNLFIDKVFVSKINNDRKHIKLDIIFNFKNPDMDIEIDMNKNIKGKSKQNSNLEEKYLKNMKSTGYKLSQDNSFLRDKFLSLNTQESGVCRTWKETW